MRGQVAHRLFLRRQHAPTQRRDLFRKVRSQFVGQVCFEADAGEGDIALAAVDPLDHQVLRRVLRQQRQQLRPASLVSRSRDLHAIVRLAQVRHLFLESLHFFAGLFDAPLGLRQLFLLLFRAADARLRLALGEVEPKEVSQTQHEDHAARRCGQHVESLRRHRLGLDSHDRTPRRPGQRRRCFGQPRAELFIRVERSPARIIRRDAGQVRTGGQAPAAGHVVAERPFLKGGAPVADLRVKG